MGSQGTKAVETEVIVLRSIRYREADRIIHAISPDLGRVHAIARGARKPKSKLGARLEPLSITSLELARGRGELMTVTGATTLQPLHRALTHHESLQMAQRATQIVDRICVAQEPAPKVYGLFRTFLTLLDQLPESATEAKLAAFQLKLLVALGVAPALGACSVCSASGPLQGFNVELGGVVCSAHLAGSQAVPAEAIAFMLDALARPLAEAPELDRGVSIKVQRLTEQMLQVHLGVAPWTVRS